MAGRAKIPIYQYTDDGKFLKKWDCINDVRKHYFPDDIGVRPMFGQEYMGVSPLPDDTWIAKSRVGKEGLRKILYRRSSPFVDGHGKRGTGEVGSRGIVVTNLDNQVMATFQNPYIMSKLTGISTGSIYSGLKSGNHNRVGLKYTYQDGI